MLSLNAAGSRLFSVFNPKSLNRLAAALLSTSAIKKSVEVPEVMVKDRAKESKSFCMNLFRGRAVLDEVFPYPLKLSDERRETLQMLLEPTEKFFKEVNDASANDANSNIPKEVLSRFAELGVLGAVVPEEYEGASLSNSQMARIVEIIGANDLSLGVTLAAHMSIGYKGILLYGTPEQKQKYLPDLATGRKFAAYCLTEPGSGSDANSISTRAEKDESGHYRISGGKIWISNGGFADVFTVFAQTPIKKADGSVKDQVSAFIVERAFGGVTSGPPEKKMGIKGSNTAEVYFDNVKVPPENLLGEEGQGFKVAMNILNNGRFGLLAACVGSMRYCIDKTIEHVSNRVQFGRKLRDFGNVQEKLADMILRHYATESIVYMLASNMDKGILEYQLEAAVGKFLASENAWQVTDDAIQLHGGMGFMRDCGLERVQRDLRIFRIFEGANDVMRLFVALTGVQHAGKHAKQLATTDVAGDDEEHEIDFQAVVNPELKQEAREVEKLITQFGEAARQLLKKHREKIIGRQYELIRLANACAEIYSMMAVLSRATMALDRSGEAAALADLKIARLYVHQSARRAIRSLRDASNGHPVKREIELIGEVSHEVCSVQAIPYKRPIEL